MVNARYIENSESTNCSKLIVLAGLLVLLCVGLGSTQDVSTEVLPSEDELLDALVNGEIDYELYQTLSELLVNGVDSSQRYLLEFIPGIWSSRRRATQTALESEQVRGFVEGVSQSDRSHGQVAYRYGQELEENGRSRYRVVSRYVISPQVIANLSLAREFSGRERVLNRALVYRAESTQVVRRITVGSFRERFGLGTVIGYRGKLLQYSDLLDGESWAFPDWGGFNGVEIEAVRGRMSTTVLGSFNSDTLHTLATLGAQAKVGGGPYAPTFIAAVNTLSNRANGRRVSVFQGAINLTEESTDRRVALEVFSQVGERKAAGAMVECERDFQSAGFLVSGWMYGRGFMDLSSGSRAASLSVTQEVDEVEFTFSEKRAGQHGVLVKSDLAANAGTTVLGEFLWAARGSDTMTAQGLIGVGRNIGHDHAIRIDYQYKTTERLGAGDNTRRRGRVEWNWQTGRLRVRSSVSFTNETTHGEYWSWLVNLTRTMNRDERWQVWSNWRRLTHARVDYWYGFVSIRQPIFDRISAGVKLAHTFDRTATPRHSASFTLELAAQL